MVLRALQLLTVALLATAIGFVMVQALPGDAALALLGDSATAEQLARVRAELGLDRPWPMRYLTWLSDALKGNLGATYAGEAVAPLLTDRLAVSAQLMLMTQVLALAVAIPAALWCAWVPRSLPARLASFVALLALSTPTYVFAVLLLLFFAVRLDWLPASGYVPLSDDVFASLRSLLLAASTLALVEIPIYLRVLRTELTQTLAQPFVRTARAFGAPTHSLLWRDVLRPASVALITVIGLNIGHLVAGAVVVEHIFALPGMGRTLLDAIYARDAPTLQGAIAIIAAVFVAVNLVVDFANGRLDPRARA